jgi:hypothetical protein
LADINRGGKDIMMAVSIWESGSGGDEEGKRERVHRLGFRERPAAHDLPDQIFHKILGIQI